MKNIAIIIAFFFSFISLSYADSSQAEPVRQAKIQVKIEKSTFVVAENGLPGFISTPVCEKQSLINVYKENGDLWSSLTPEDLRIFQCDGELFGQKVSVTVGGALSLFQRSYADKIIPMKGAALFLSWGAFDMEVPMIVHSPSSDPWLRFQDVLAPISTGKIVDSVPQPPEPAEFFTAVISIEDEAL